MLASELIKKLQTEIEINGDNHVYLRWYDAAGGDKMDRFDFLRTEICDRKFKADYNTPVIILET